MSGVDERPVNCDFEVIVVENQTDTNTNNQTQPPDKEETRKKRAVDFVEPRVDKSKKISKKKQRQVSSYFQPITNVTCVAGANQLQAINRAGIQTSNEEKENQQQVVLSPPSDGPDIETVQIDDVIMESVTPEDAHAQPEIAPIEQLVDDSEYRPNDVDGTREVPPIPAQQVEKEQISSGKAKRKDSEKAKRKKAAGPYPNEPKEKEKQSEGFVDAWLQDPAFQLWLQKAVDPYSNAIAERLFSFLKLTKTDHRGALKEDTILGLMRMKYFMKNTDTKSYSVQFPDELVQRVLQVRANKTLGDTTSQPTGADER